MGILDRLIAKNVEKYVYGMIEHGQSEADYPSLGFDAARAYARSNGATSYPDMRDSIGFEKQISGRIYWIFFTRGRAGRGTSISLTHRSIANETDTRAAPSSSSHRSGSAYLKDGLHFLESLSPAEMEQRRPWRGDMQICERFLSSLGQHINTSDVATAYFYTLLQGIQGRSMLLSFLSFVEDSGASLQEQEDAAFELIKYMWDRMDRQGQLKFLAFGRLP
ncbi:hypothetical protein [Sphingomonas trueperi]|uniref:hypothetical protein n=1 Tax=Sphingomonas trueperi TaxID=53317 RepID=UPI000F0F180E